MFQLTKCYYCGETRECTVFVNKKDKTKTRAVCHKESCRKKFAIDTLAGC